MRPDDPPVRNATPDPMRVPLALACLARGLPALLEKPVIDAADAASALEPYWPSTRRRPFSRIGR